MADEQFDISSLKLQDAKALAAGYSKGMRRFEIVSIFTFFVLIAVLVTRMAAPALTAPWLVAVAVLVGFVAADFVSGIVHWLADTWGATDMPVLGSTFIRPFREHHVDQEAITHHDFVETNGANCIVSIPVAVGALLIPLGNPVGLFACAFLTSMIMWVFGTNQTHKWAHMKTPPAFVGWLQKMHLVLPRGHHSLHHTAPFNKYYCITVGWMNWPLYKLHFFEAMEWLITSTTGAIPRKDDIGETAARAIAPVTAPPPVAETRAP